MSRLQCRTARRRGEEHAARASHPGETHHIDLISPERDPVTACRPPAGRPGVGAPARTRHPALAPQDKKDREEYWASRCRETFVVFEPKEGLGVGKESVPRILQVSAGAAPRPARGRPHAPGAAQNPEPPPTAQALGLNPGPEIIAMFESKLFPPAPPPDEEGNVTDEIENIKVDRFLEVVPPMLADPKQAHLWVRDSYHALVKAFRVFDPAGKGWVDVHDLLEELRGEEDGSGSGFTDEEMKGLMDQCNIEDGQHRVYYEEFCEKLAEDGRGLF